MVQKKKTIITNALVEFCILRFLLILKISTCGSLFQSQSQHPARRCLAAHVQKKTQDPGPSQSHLSRSDSR